MADTTTQPAGTAPAEPGRLSPQDHRRLAVDLFNETWTLLDRASRTAAEIDAMIHTAHASRYHWQHAANSTPNNLARGEWQCSRVYAVLGRGEPALWHARRVLEICEGNGIRDWDLAYAFEALARASRVAGDEDAAQEWLSRARAAADGIAEEDDREHLLSDLATI